MRCIGCGGSALNYNAEAVLAARERNRKRGYIISCPPKDNMPEAA
jgi:hypothetical protein